MTPSDFEPLVRGVLAKIGASCYGEVVASAPSEPPCLPEDVFDEVVRDWGVTPIAPPHGADLEIGVVPYRDDPGFSWWVDCRIWTREEGRSSLRLTLWVTRDGDTLRASPQSLG